MSWSNLIGLRSRIRENGSPVPEYVASWFANNQTKSANFPRMLTFCINVGVAIVRVLYEEERVLRQAL